MFRVAELAARFELKVGGTAGSTYVPHQAWLSRDNCKIDFGSNFNFIDRGGPSGVVAALACVPATRHSRPEASRRRPPQYRLYEGNFLLSIIDLVDL